MTPINGNEDQSFSTYEGEVFDRTLHSVFRKYLGLFSPPTLIMSYVDWFANLRICPAKQLDIYRYFIEQHIEWIKDNVFSQELCTITGKCHPNDPRFKHPGWNDYPFNLIASMFLIYEATANYATQDIRGVSRHHMNVVNFVTRQLLDIMSPSNVPWLNPEVIEKAMLTKGANFTNGLRNFWDDYLRFLTDAPQPGVEQFQVGKDVAITPGKVIFRNNLIELIQYSPSTTQVSKEPILIVPAWIMKYYILDLSPHNSMVKYLVEQGHTVFMISWKNPDGSYRDLHFNSYIDLGILPALAMINKIIPNTKVHTVGYCIGGTLLAIAAAAMAGRHDDRIASITLFAAQVDFKDAGELTVLIDASQVAYLEDIMWENGYLDGAQMGGTFSMLHSSELIWSRLVRDYLLGETEPMFDIMAWDNDTTRLPYRMHSEYLRKLFLNNELVQGLYTVDDKVVSLANIKVPIFAVGTLTDHVAPWQSVYKIHLFTQADITFVLTNGGHNAGILSEPGHAKRNFKMLNTLQNAPRYSASEWLDVAPEYTGSWWPSWHGWLQAQDAARYTTPPPMGDPQTTPQVLGDAPGTYVMQK